jgi:ABC-type glutathione transport system ATPase component
MLVEHKTEWIAEFADRVIVLRDGTVARDGKPRAVLTSAQMPELGIAATRYTEAARAAQPAGWGAWSQNLPVTLNEAVAGFESLRGGV